MIPQPLKPGDKITEAVRLVRPLAEGGMGRVWIAEHAGLNAEVVVKLMAPEMAAMPDGAERFAREAEIAAAIKSPHVVQVFDHGITVDAFGEGTPYIVMERLEGMDLGARLDAQGPMDPADVVTLVVQIGKALARAHKAGIVHRDIKPDNIFLCETDGGEIFGKLLDFGTARREAGAGKASSRTTMPGQIMGTPYYMSPEQSVGAPSVGERSDIWSLGVVVYEALTGHKPFDGSSVGAITVAIHGRLPRLTERAPALPVAVDAWFERACAQAPEERFASVREAATALAIAIAGVAPLEMPTESIVLPVLGKTLATASDGTTSKTSTPIRPVTRSAAPLIESLPQRGSERRVTAIAAGLVMAATAIVMVAIVASRTSSPQAGSAVSAPQSVPAASATMAPAPPLPPPSLSEPTPAPPPAVTPPEPVPAKPTPPIKAAAKAAAKVPPRPAVHEPQPKAAKTPARTTHAGAKDAGASDDDLVRLANAAAKHAETPAPVTPTVPAESPRPPPPLPEP